MILPPIWLLLVLAAGLPHTLGSESTEDVPSDKAEAEPAPNDRDKSYSDTEPLFLTPYINACQFDTAKQLSKVTYFKNFTSADAYSGYITVNKSTESNLFFLFFEPQENEDNAPLLLWTQGGPGLSALFGLFLENGPAAFHGPQMILQRTNTLQKHMGVIYLDLPVGAGFSYTGKGAYPNKLEDIVQHVMEFLKQFLELFDKYKGRDIYLAGESYGARYSVAVGDYMLQNPEQLEVRLAGVIGGNGFLGPVLQTADSSDFLYETSMLTAEGRTNFSTQFKIMMGLLQLAATNETIGQYLLQMLFNTIFTNTPKTLFQNLTLYDDHASPLYTERPLYMQMCYFFLNTSIDFKKAIHVGVNATFQYNNEYLLYTFAPDWLRDIRNITQRVLAKTRVLFYLGQLDALFPSVRQRAHLAELEWPHAHEYHKAPRTPWKPPTWPQHRGFAGYTRKVTNFTEAVLLEMSHYGAVEKPDEVYWLVMEFVNNSAQVSNELAAAHAAAGALND